MPHNNDITQQQSIQKNKQWDAIFNATTDFVALIDKEGKIIQANQAFVDYYGVSLDQLIGTSLFSNASKQLIQQRRQIIDRILSTGHPERLEQQDEDRCFEYSFFPLKENRQNGQMLALFVRDVTQFKELMDERERDRRILKETNAELEGIIRIASHDLKTPLVTINGFAGELSSACKQLVELLSQCDQPAPMKQKVQDIIEKDILIDVDLIKAGTGKIESLVSSLLKLARIGYKQPQMELVEMNPLIDRVVKSMAYQIKETKVRVDVESLCNCFGDQNMINQAMTNLISNAIKYRHPDRPGQIKISCQDLDDQCVYCIADNGIGVPLSHRERIFELFYRMNSETEDSQGIGLSIVRGIVNRHNGRIWLESEPDKGSRFYMTLPNPDYRSVVD